MKTATVIRHFLRNEVEMTPGQTFQCSDEEHLKWQRLGFVAGYETKVEPAPEVKKKDTPSASSRRGRAPRKKTLKSSSKSATK